MSPALLPAYDDWCAGGGRRSDLPGTRHAIFVRVEGPLDGAALTLLHGFPSSSHDWAAILPDLTGAGFRVTMLDFLGYGNSDKPAGHRYSLMEQADIVEAVWAATGVEQTALVAHDYGVSVGQELLARNPDRVTRMTWLNGGLYPDLHRPTRVQKLLHGKGGPLVARAFRQELFASSIREVFGRELSDADAEQMWRALQLRDGHLRTPVVPRLRERIPAGTIHVLDAAPPVGHYPQVEAPELVGPLLVQSCSGSA